MLPDILSTLIRRDQRSPKGMVVTGSVVILLFLGGCASTRTSRWVGKNQVTSDPTKQTDPSEPVVAANVAVKPTESQDRIAAEWGVTERSSKPSFNWFDNRSALTESALTDGTNKSDLIESSTASEDNVADLDRSDTSIDRLNAALTQDMIQTQTLPERSLTGLDDRLKADSLLFRARRLLEVGQLEQARQAAQSAQELGDRAQLDYSPDEERPIDVVRQIDRQLESTTVDLKSPTNLENDSPSIESKGSEHPSTGTGEPSKSAGKSLIRREWSTFFRREKKSGGSESEPVHIAKKPRWNSHSRLELSSEKVTLTASSGSSDAIVTANRSVSLGLPEAIAPSTSESTVDIAPDIESPIDEDNSPTTLNSTQTNLTSAEDEAVGSNRSTRLRVDRDADDAVNRSLEFDIADSSDPFDKPKSTQNDRFKSTSIESLDAAGEFNRGYFYLGFGICSLLAWICYRRGAT